MNLGTFSLSLTVKDIKASRAFYEKLGFTKLDGDEAQNWLIMECGTTKIGLFQGMFDKNIITFNPTDARAIQKHLKTQGVELTEEADEASEGIAHFALVDPDGNPLLFDQHDPDDPSMPKKHGKISWVDLTVPDADNVRDFYKAVADWTSEGLAMGEGYEDYIMKSADGQAAAGVCWKKGVNADVPSGWMVYITVADLDAALERTKSNGGKVINVRKNDEGKSYMAYIEDPSGAVSALYQG